jgi:hypothetical protein
VLTPLAWLVPLVPVRGGALASLWSPAGPEAGVQQTPAREAPGAAPPSPPEGVAQAAAPPSAAPGAGVAVSLVRGVAGALFGVPAVAVVDPGVPGIAGNGMAGSTPPAVGSQVRGTGDSAAVGIGLPNATSSGPVCWSRCLVASLALALGAELPADSCCLRLKGAPAGVSVWGTDAHAPLYKLLNQSHIIYGIRFRLLLDIRCCDLRALQHWRRDEFAASQKTNRAHDALKSDTGALFRYTRVAACLNVRTNNSSCCG